MAAGCLSEASTVEAVATGKVIPLMEGLVAHGMARKGSSSAFAPRFRAAVETDGARVVKRRVKWAMGSGALGGLEEGVEGGGLDRGC